MSVRGYGGFGSGYGAPYWPTGRYSSPGYYNQALEREGWLPDWANMEGGVNWPPQGGPPMTGPAVNAFIDGTGVTTFTNPEPIVNDGALEAAIASGGEALSGLIGGFGNALGDLGSIVADVGERIESKIGIPWKVLGLVGIGLLVASGGSGSSGTRKNPHRRKHRRHRR